MYMCIHTYYKTLLCCDSLSYCFSQEVDPTVETDDMAGPEGMDGLFSDLANAIPGIDEAMSFAEMLK